MVNKCSFLSWKASYLSIPIRVMVVEGILPASVALTFYQLDNLQELFILLRENLGVVTSMTAGSFQLCTFQSNHIFIWIDILNVTKEDSIWLQHYFNLDPLTASHLYDSGWGVDDVTFFERREYVSSSFQFLQLSTLTEPTLAQRQETTRRLSMVLPLPPSSSIAGIPCTMAFTTVPVEVILSPNCILTVRHGQPCTSVLTGLNQRIIYEFMMESGERNLYEAEEGFCRRFSDPEDIQVTSPTKLTCPHHPYQGTASWVLYSLLDSDVDNLIAMTQQIRLECHQLEDFIFSTSPREWQQVLRQLTCSRSRALKVRQLMESKQRLMLELCSPNLPRQIIAEKLRPLYWEVYHHVSSSSRQITTAYEVARDASSHFLTRINADLARRDRDMNLSLKRLGWVTLVLYPLSHVVGLLGMNLRHPLLWTMNVTGVALPECVGWFVVGAILATVGVVSLLPIYWKWEPRQRAFVLRK